MTVAKKKGKRNHITVAKKLAKFIAAMLFTSFLSLFVILFSAQDMTSYATLKSLSKETFLESASQINIFIEQSCKNSPRLEIPLQNERLSFECSEIKSAEMLFDKIFDKGYYRNFSCSLIECVKNPSALLSSIGTSSGNMLVSSFLWISALISVISGAILLLLLEKRIKGLGMSLIFVGINSVLLLFVKSAIPTTNIATIDSLINSIFSQMSWNFFLILATGIVLAAVGYCKGRNRPEKPRSVKILKGRRT